MVINKHIESICGYLSASKSIFLLYTHTYISRYIFYALALQTNGIGNYYIGFIERGHIYVCECVCVCHE